MANQPSIRDIILIFFRRKMLFVLVFVLVCLGGGAYLLLKEPQYLSTASLVLHFDHEVVPNIDRVDPKQPLGPNERREILYSDADILKSTGVVHKVIDKVGLANLYPHIAARTDYSDAKKFDLATRNFMEDFVVDVGLQSDVLNVSFFNANAVIARDTVKELLSQFFDQEADVYANPQLAFAESEATAARKELTDAQNKLSDFKAKHQIADLQQQISQYLQQRTDVESRLHIAQGRVLEAQQRQDALKQLLDTIPAMVTTSATGEQYHAADDAESRLDQLRAKRSQMASTYQSNSPIFQQLDAQIASLSAAARTRSNEAHGRNATQPNKVYESIKTDYMRAAAEATSAKQPQDVLTQQLAQINAHIDDLEAQQNQYDDLTRTVQIQNDTYKTLAIRYETARVEANRNAQKISAAVLIATPTVAPEPARPRRKLVALATLITAFVLSCSVVLGVEGFDDRFRSPRDVTRVLRLPVLATFAQDT